VVQALQFGLEMPMGQSARMSAPGRPKGEYRCAQHEGHPVTRTLTITRPDDWHLHLRDGAAMASVLPFTAAQFSRAIVMPNLKPPVTTAAAAQAYRQRIVAALPKAADGADFTPLMTLYLTDNTPPEEIRRAREAGVVALKLYPAGATTNSDAGVSDIRKTYATLEAMQREGLLLLVHGEVTDPEIDIFDREAVFIDRVMQPLRHAFPELKVVFEHITTAEAAEYVAAADAQTAATITAHHLLYNRNALFTGGLRPHWYCLPVLKKERHRQALVRAATGGSHKFFLGTDSAPHAAAMKEQSVCGAGCFTAPSALELYAEAFEAADALDRLEAFASFNGPAFYGLPRNSGTVTLMRQPWTLPESMPFADATIKPLRAGETLHWKLQS
jgi:dihydroorotase